MSKKNKLISVLCGVLTGSVNGLFGGGGGMIVVPLLTNFLKKETKIAHATAILIMLPISVASGILYIIFESVKVGLLWKVSLGTLIGGLIGAFLLKKLNSKIVSIIFSAVMLVAGVKLLFF